MKGDFFIHARCSSINSTLESKTTEQCPRGRLFIYYITHMYIYIYVKSIGTMPCYCSNHVILLLCSYIICTSVDSFSCRIKHAPPKKIKPCGHHLDLMILFRHPWEKKPRKRIQHSRKIRKPAPTQRT